MSDIDEKEIIKRFETISQFKLAPEIAARDIARVRQKLTEQGAGQRTGLQDIRRTIMKSRITKLAAAAAIIIAVLIGINQFGGSVALTTPTFADVVAPLITAHTATFKVTIKAEGQPAQIADAMFKEPLRMCMVTANGRTIIDFNPDDACCKIINLILSEKKAIVIETENIPDDEEGYAQYNMFHELRRRILKAKELGDEAIEFLGEQQIDGQTAIGYHVPKPDLDITVWANKESLLPIRTETTVESRAWTVPITFIWTDFAFNVDVDESLFRVPDDFSVTTMQHDASEPGEEDLIEVFQKWAECVDGKFPSVLKQEAVKEYIEAYGKKAFPNFRAGDKLSDKQQQEMLQIFSKIERAFTFVKSLPAESDWHYAGRDATFGDTETAIFWYRPQGSRTYRVIYGDLNVKDVPPENLPK